MFNPDVTRYEPKPFTFINESDAFKNEGSKKRVLHQTNARPKPTKRARREASHLAQEKDILTQNVKAELAKAFAMEELDVLLSSLDEEGSDFLLNTLSCLAKHLPREELPRISTKIYFYFKHSLSVYTLAGDLGCVLFAWENDSREVYEKWLSNDIVSLLQYYNDAIVNEIKSRKNNAHQLINWNTKSCLPLGIPHLQLEAIVDLLLTKEGKINFGGIVAADLLLTRLSFGTEIKSLTQWELIHTLLLKIMGSQTFRHRIENVGIPLPCYSVEILATLKLPLFTTITKPLFQKALLISFFSELYQYTYQGNCYNLATIMAGRLTHPEKTFSLFEGIFLEDKMTIGNETFPVPLTLVWRDQYTDDSDFSVTVSGLAFSLPLFANILKVCGLKPSDISSNFVPWKDYQLKHFFDVIESVASGLLRAYAEKVYLSYKDPIMLRMLLCKVEFYIANGEYASDALSYKRYLLNEVNESIHITLALTLPYQSQDAEHIREVNYLRRSLFFHVSAYLNRYFWVDDFSQNTPEFSNNTLSLKRRRYTKHFHCDENILENISSFVTHMKPFFTYQGGVKKEIDSFDHFRSMFDAVIKDVLAHLKHLSRVQKIEVRIPDLSPEPLVEAATNAVIDFNMGTSLFENFTERILKNLDFCYMKHLGHHPNVIISHVLGCSFDKETVFIPDAKSFFTSYPWADNSDKKFEIEDLPEVVLTESSDPRHSFVTFPRLFAEFLRKGAETLIGEYVLDPAEAILSAPINRRRAAKILELIEYSGNREDALLVASLSARDFKNFLMATINNDFELEQFKDKFDKVCSWPPISDLADIQKVELFIAQLQEKYPDEFIFREDVRQEIIKNIRERFFDYFHNKNVLFIGSSEFVASKILDIMQKRADRSFNRLMIEKTIAIFLKAPLSIEIGETNYAPEVRESLFVDKVVVRFDFIEEEMLFKIRKRDSYAPFLLKKPSLEDQVAFIYYQLLD